jgi:hypothetical protein
MIIWGSRGREIEEDRGRFHCPQCEESQQYKKVRVASYFTLYFIPLFETQHHGHFIECMNCQGKFKPAVLEYEPPSQAERVVGMIRTDLASGTPVQMARTKLTNAGVEAETAEKLVAAAAGDDLQTCTACNLNFVSSISKCSACGGSLNTDTRFRA